MGADHEMNRRGRPPLPVPFYYGWVVVAVTFLTSLNGAGVRAAAGVFIVPLESEFGWSRAAIVSAFSITLFLYGAAAPISGWLLDRYGQRRVMLGSLTFLAAGVGGITMMDKLWQLMLLWGVVVGLAAGGMSSVLAASVAHRWFTARRGLALGILNSASSTGQLLFIWILMALIVAAGWRVASLFMVMVSIGLIILIFFLMRDDPSDVGLEPYNPGVGAGIPGGQASLRHGAEGASIGILEAIKNPTFWLLCGVFSICGGTANGLVGMNLIPHALDRGIPAMRVALTFSVMGGMNFVGTLTSGWLTDRMDPRKLLAMVFSLRGLSLFILPFVTEFWGLFAFGVVYGLDWFATVPPVVTIAGETFGKRSIGRIYGWIFLSHQLGATFAAIGAGAIFAWAGDYGLAFLTGGVMGLIAAGMALSIKSPPQIASMQPESTGVAPA